MYDIILWRILCSLFWWQRKGRYLVEFWT